jgi:hypothetical protein
MTDNERQLEKIISELNAENERLRSVLGIYANPGNWQVTFGSRYFLFKDDARDVRESNSRERPWEIALSAFNSGGKQLNMRYLRSGQKLWYTHTLDKSQSVGHEFVIKSIGTKWAHSDYGMLLAGFKGFWSHPMGHIQLFDKYTNPHGWAWWSKEEYEAYLTGES